MCAQRKKKQKSFEMRNEQKTVLLNKDPWMGFRESVNSFEI